jgi:uncharacterized protein YdhG (YjbR/CyaY superfamily)
MGIDILSLAMKNPIDEYLAAVAEPSRGTLEQLRAMIRAVVPEGTTEEISYQVPTFKYKGSLVAFAAFQKHCSLFPCSGSLTAALAEDLRGYKTSKGTIQFPVGQPLPAALVQKIVRLRVAENEAKAGAAQSAGGKKGGWEKRGWEKGGWEKGG